MMAKSILCPFCLAVDGLKAEDIDEKSFPDDDAFADHLEEEHDIIVRRDDEDDDKATKRVKEKNPRIGTDKCKCPECLLKRGEDIRPALVGAYQLGK